ncbi:four helix bundle protein [Flavobacterium sp. J372]|uniref:four helix bundle protein n=1 Tax=Flavobacterium sp. J372 TaxID=2898436 RepID=UPI00215182A6|nr:four helix bundle protein [Flavobacterium sp. J372]MCR5862473.1 four helix bundle protein [Flavobacterium sp. J372]
MKNENVVQQKSYAFAIRIINAYKYLHTEQKEYVLSKQLLRCGTSIGANIEEAIGGQSQKDFFAKLTIAYKEARETQYWLRLLRDTHYLTTEQSDSLITDVNELLRIIGSIQKTLRNS